MNKLFATLCIVGTALVLSACETAEKQSYDSGASYATDRTAGDVDARSERVFRRVQSK